jgi:hypothetical protein
VRRLLRGAQACGLATAAVGALALVGWGFDIVLFKQLHPELGAMAPGSAVALVLAGTTLWLVHPALDGTWWGRGGRVLPWLVLAISGLTLGQYLLDIQLGIDELMFSDPEHAVQTSHPGRMSIVAALAFLMLGAALVLVRRPEAAAQRIARLLALVTSAMLLVGLLGFLYG